MSDEVASAVGQSTGGSERQVGLCSTVYTGPCPTIIVTRVSRNSSPKSRTSTALTNFDDARTVVARRQHSCISLIQVDPGRDHRSLRTDRDRDLVTDGGREELAVGRDLVMEFVENRTSTEPDGEQDALSNLWTGKQHLKSDATESEELERSDIAPILEDLVRTGDLVYWHGLVAPATDEHLKAIIENEGQCEIARNSLIGLCNSIRQGETVEATVDKGDGVATDGGEELESGGPQSDWNTDSDCVEIIDHEPEHLAVRRWIDASRRGIGTVRVLPGMDGVVV